jgi:hypothetical protein
MAPGSSSQRSAARQALLRSASVAGLAVVLTGCAGIVPPPVLETAYVAGAAVELRSELGPATRVSGTLESGERVEVLSKRPRWAEVRRASGETGWVQQRFLVSQDIFDQFDALYRTAEALPSQGAAVVLRDANLHTEPGRSTPIFYQLPGDEKVEVVGHGVEERAFATDGDVAVYEDWVLVRAASRRAGWMLESSLQLDPPMEVARYREGLRLRAWFVIHREIDDGQERPWYLWAGTRQPGATRTAAGAPYEFEEIRVFVWNPAADRYETSYRERGLTGFYPVEVSRRQTPEGPTPAFRFHVEDADGERIEKNYVMAGRQVRTAR